MRLLLSLSLLAAVPLSAQPAAQPTPASVSASATVNPKAMELFESDWVLMDWGLRFHDQDRDAQLSAAEATAGARAFKEMADSDNDGKVTPAEFRRAREFLLARY